MTFPRYYGPVVSFVWYENRRKYTSTVPRERAGSIEDAKRYIDEFLSARGL